MGHDDPTDGSQWFDDTNSSTTTLPSITTTTFPGTFALEPLPSSSSVLRYLHFSSLLLVTTAGLLSNGLVLLLFYRRPALRTFSNRFVLNLSASHFWQCLVALPASLLSVAEDGWVLGPLACAVCGFLFTALNVTSVLTLLLIALDRNCAVNSPLHYSMTVTKKRTGCLIFLTWFVGGLVGSPPFAGVSSIQYRPKWKMCTVKWTPYDPYSVGYATVLIALGFAVPFITTICVYSSMFQAARDNSERARKHSVNSTSVENSLPPPEPKSNVPKKKYRRWSSGSNQFFGEEWKAVRTGMLVVTSFTLCWLPYFSVISLEAFFGAGENIPDHAMLLVVLCSSVACVINPYLYVFRNKTSRKHVKQMICPSNLTKNKRWMFHRASRDKGVQAGGVNPCILTASLENEGSEKVKALPALFQDMEGHWQVFSTSSREELDETVSNVSDDDFFETGTLPQARRKNTNNTKPNVQAIYNTSYNNNTRNFASQPKQPSSNRLMLFRLKTSLNRDSTSSDTTENCSMSLESNNSNDPEGASAPLPSRRGIGKYLFNTSEELWESRPSSSYPKRVNSVGREDPAAECRKNLSSFGSARRKSFIHSHIKNKKSNETTLTSSTNSETLESSSTASTRLASKDSRPKLVRQVEILEPPVDYGGT